MDERKGRTRSQTLEVTIWRLARCQTLVRIFAFFAWVSSVRPAGCAFRIGYGPNTRVYDKKVRFPLQKNSFNDHSRAHAAVTARPVNTAASIVRMVSTSNLRAFALVTCVKLLLIPCYYSTDFEVHRNWIALTGSLTLEEWYTDATSQWTLDYPPLFAHFEGALARVAKVVDPKMLTVQKEPYTSFACIVFQRCTVIFFDVVLALGAWQCTSSLTKKSTSVKSFAAPLATVLVLFSPGLLLIDHVHFQYNGLGLGIQLTAMAAALKNKPITCAFLFSIMVHFKHVFAYAAPGFAAHLLAHHVPGGWSNGWFNDSRRLVKIVKRCSSYIGVALFVSILSLGPFVYSGQLDAVLSRLFPFGRGLTHAYWAANFWALYSISDKILVKALRLVGVTLNAPTGYLSGGMTGHGGSFSQTHVALPTITPSISLLLVVLSSAPALYAHLITKTQTLKQSSLPRLIAYTNLCAFYFGWHVHEKAILTVLVPAGIAIAIDADDESIGAKEFAKQAGEFLFLSVVGTYALLPLLFESREYWVKHFICVVWFVAATGLLKEVIASKRGGKERKESIYPELFTQTQLVFISVCLPLVELYTPIGHTFLFGPVTLEFLPLALVSVTCAVGVTTVLVPQILGRGYM